MTDTLRVTVTAPDMDKANEIKEQFFKKLYEHAGTKVVFELPLGDDAGAKEIEDAAKAAGCEASTETYSDPLDNAEGVDFW